MWDSNIDTHALEVLSYWFDCDLSNPAGASTGFDVWFSTNPAYDDALRTRFKTLVDRARCEELDHWRNHPHETLALLLLTDQIPRNIYRRRPEAFAADHYAQAVALDAISREYHRAVPLVAALASPMINETSVPACVPPNVTVQGPPADPVTAT